MTHGTHMRTAPARRIRFLLSGVLVLAALIGAGLYLGRSAFSAGPESGRAVASPPATAARCGASAASPCAPSPDGIAVAAPPAAAKLPPRPSPRAVATATRTTSAPPSAPASPAPVSATTSQDDAAATQVLALINQARAAAGLPALTITSGLEASSSAHNLRMADGCGLSHQCPGEPPLGDRETAAGVHWTAAGENIGEGGPVAGTPAAIAEMAVGLTQSMLNEKPPDDGHRLNILSSTFTHIGIAVGLDSSGTVWLTQDFSN